MTKYTKRKGFTLVELFAVIAIIAIIATVAILGCVWGAGNSEESDNNSGAVMELTAIKNDMLAELADGAVQDETNNISYTLNNGTLVVIKTVSESTTTSETTVTMDMLKIAFPDLKNMNGAITLSTSADSKTEAKFSGSETTLQAVTAVYYTAADGESSAVWNLSADTVKGE